GTELTILALLLLVGGGMLWRVEPGGSAGAAPLARAERANPAPSARGGGTAAIAPKSIAVLPFDSLSDDKANAYFATGMQDEILTRLAGIGDLKVISRSSTARYAS